MLLLHGLGASGDVWQGVVDRLDPDVAWVAPDLSGHGRSGPLTRYSFGALAAAVADTLDRDRPITVLGHSLGGVVALALASGWFDVPVTAVCGLGIKVRWSVDELARARDLAAKPRRIFATRAEALDRAVLVAGLKGLVDHDGADALVTEADGGWQLALDPAAFAVGEPHLPGLLSAARGPVVLAAGEHDPMCPREHLRALVADPVALADAGHNAHVEKPADVAALIGRLAYIPD